MMEDGTRMTVPDHRTILAENVRRYRKQRGITQDALASACGLTQTTISDVETGKGNPTFDVLCKLAAALQVPPIALVPGADDAVREFGDAVLRGKAWGAVLGHLVGAVTASLVSKWLVTALIQTTDSKESARDVSRSKVGDSLASKT
jgi:transcriptional regulator with XRE-family HTH domain